MLSGGSELAIEACHLWASLKSVAGLFCWRNSMSVFLGLSFYPVPPGKALPVSCLQVQAG